MARRLKVWNSAWYPFRGQHIYVCAYSQKDALALIGELYGHSHNVTLGEIKRMWSAGCWGTAMDGIERERGAWLMERHGRPVRVQPGTLK